MPPARRRNLLRGRRRVEDEGEDDDEVVDAGDDSGSEASALSDAEDGSALGDSDLSDNDDAEPSSPVEVKTRKEEPATTTEESAVENTVATPAAPPAITETPIAPTFQATADTLVMLNGFKSEDTAGPEEVVDFEEETTQLDDEQSPAQQEQSIQNSSETPRETVFQRRAREREEYKLKKETDPSFVPNRGGFFMHDSRNEHFAQPRPVVFSGARGRGDRNFTGPARLPFRLRNPSGDASLSKWNHDLHETVNKPVPASEQKHVTSQHPSASIAGPRLPQIAHSSPLSKSTSVGTVMIRCSIPSSQRPVKLLKMTVRQHTRLPDLRPPLRRDKPVRVALPDCSPRYIFPSIERSFIFIPRAQRPNQQAARGRLRSVFSGSGSRRASAYGGSVYEPSISISRKSSLAPDMLPAFAIGQLPVAIADFGRPVVRLPSNAHLYQPVANTSELNSDIAQPVIPDARNDVGALANHTVQIPMHQPRPQKTVSLATIESPARAPLHAPQQQEQQPFYHQVPAHMTGQILAERHEVLSSSQFATSNAARGGQVAGNSIEAAINAEPFQPAHIGQEALYNTSYTTAQPAFYYNMPPDGQAEHYTGDPLAAPVYVQQGAYLVPMYMPQNIGPDEAAAIAQAGMYAQERNGMVYYYDSNPLGPNTESGSAMGYSVPGAGGMMTPGPEGYYYNQGAPGIMNYYPTQQ